MIALEVRGDPVGQSFLVDAPTRDLAPGAGRLAARRAGIRSWKTARILHVEIVEPGRYEVVVQTGLVPAVRS